ncbi:MAG TPA: leucine-rich repeat domain-containing protein [Patescibacteria group bacterium]|nr:leucine-rich repeat domain-containing protein [Patescibacteria group bacterium]
MYEELAPRDKQALTRLQKTLKSPIPKKKQITWNCFGYTVEEGVVVGLGLYNRGLTEVPPEIEDLEHLKILRMRNNPVKSIPCGLFKRAWLVFDVKVQNDNGTEEKYRLYHGTPVLKKESMSLEKIEELLDEQAVPKKEHRGTELFRVECEVMEKLERLLGGKAIPKVDEVRWNTFGFISRDNHVTGLGLYEKGLATLPESIGSLSNLKELNLYKNKLTKLPESIGSLSNLKELNLGANNLSTLPESISSSQGKPKTPYFFTIINYITCN